MLGMIWAQAAERIIGKAGTVPWHVPEDLKFFRAQTSGHPVIMGRKTWESLPDSSRPLPGRDNFVITSQPDFEAPGASVHASIEDALEAAEAGDSHRLVWCIGGAQIYEAAMELADLLVITDLDITVENPDAVAPAVPFEGWNLIGADPDRGWHRSESGVNYRFSAYARKGSQLGNESEYFRR